MLHTKQGQSTPQRTTQRKHCHISELRPPFDIGFAPLDERGGGLKAGGDEGLKSVCVAYGVRGRLRLSLVWYYWAQWIELGFIQSWAQCTWSE